MANYPASQPGSQRHTLSVLVENRPGVLARIAGLFARRAFNINSLSVSPTERPDISRVTVTADVEEVPLEQIIKQLNKLLHVLKIVDLDPETTVERELVLIKVAANESNRSDVLEIVRLFRVRVVDVNPESLTIEATGAEGKIDALIFFWDPMSAQPHDVDVKALLRLATLYNVPTAINRSSADFLISSPLFEDEEYEPVVKDYKAYVERVLK